MHAVITLKESNDIVLVWLAEVAELTDGLLVCQYEGEETKFEDITSEEHTLTMVEGELPEGFQPNLYQLIDGKIVLK